MATSSSTARGNRESQLEAIGLSTADRSQDKEFPKAASFTLWMALRRTNSANEKLGTDDAETTGIWPLYNSADRNAELVANRLFTGCVGRNISIEPLYL